MNNPLYGAKKKGTQNTQSRAEKPKTYGRSYNSEDSDKPAPYRPNKIRPHKDKMHPRSKHLGSYDFDKLTEVCPELKPHVFINDYETQTIDFSSQEAVKALNKALLALHYKIDNWTIPPNYLCPPIPGRADYIHYVKDLIGEKDIQIRGIDIGVGANCIYPLLGASEYDWNFVGIDISKEALVNGQKILLSNMHLMEKIDLRHQPNPNCFFEGVIRAGERFDFVMCNPPFFGSAEEAAEANQRKSKNLNLDDSKRNFSGQDHELWSDGGEVTFIKKLIYESRDFGGQARVFTCLVSKEDHLVPIKAVLKKLRARDVQVVPMGQGQKASRFIAWRF